MSDTELIKKYSLMVFNTAKFRKVEINHDVAGLIATYLADHDGYIDDDHRLETVKLNTGAVVFLNDMVDIAKVMIQGMLNHTCQDEDMHNLATFVNERSRKKYLCKCQHCGIWYRPHNNYVYCSKECRLIALGKAPEVKKTKVNVTEHPVYRIYDRKRNSMKFMLKTGAIDKQRFDEWNLEARKKRNMVADGLMTMEEFKEWIGYKDKD